MSNGLVVRPSKNAFLLYSMLVANGFAANSDDEPVKKEAALFFRDYRGLPDFDKLPHHSIGAFFVSVHKDVPDTSLRGDIDLQKMGDEDRNHLCSGLAYAQFLEHFYKSTDFEGFYTKVLPVYSGSCRFLEDELQDDGMKDAIDAAWGSSSPSRIEVIHMPLLAYDDNFGFFINDEMYVVTGASRFFDYAGEALRVSQGSSATLTRRLVDYSRESVGSCRHLFRLLDGLKGCSSWKSAFERHFAAAMEIGFIRPELFEGTNVRSCLDSEKKQGLRFIRDFYDEIAGHKAGSGTLNGVVGSICERLVRKYG